MSKTEGSNFMTRRDVANACAMSHADAAALLKKHKLVPIHREPFGRGFIELYERTAVQPLVDAHLARVGARNKLPSVPAVAIGLEAQVKALGMTMQHQYGELLTAGAHAGRVATEQNAVLLKAIEKVNGRVNLLLTQLGVKE